MRRDVFNPPTMAPPGPYSHVVRIGPADADLVFISGQIGTDADGSLIGPGDIVAQSERAMRNIEAGLAAAGGQLTDIVKLTSYVVDFSRLSELRALRDRLFPSDPPTSTTVQVAALFSPDALIEVDAMAVVPRDRVAS